MTWKAESGVKKSAVWMQSVGKTPEARERAKLPLPHGPAYFLSLPSPVPPRPGQTPGLCPSIPGLAQKLYNLPSPVGIMTEGLRGPVPSLPHPAQLPRSGSAFLLAPDVVPGSWVAAPQDKIQPWSEAIIHTSWCVSTITGRQVGEHSPAVEAKERHPQVEDSNLGP